MKHKINKNNQGLAHIIPILLISVILIVFGFMLYQSFKPGSSDKMMADKNLPTKQFKVLHIMSYHTPWNWTEDQLAGFKDSLSELNVEYKVFEMDTKRKSSDDWIAQVSKEAKDLIDTWQPDLVYSTDDNAQKYVVVDYINTETPFVFSAVNSSPETYGYDTSTNVTGVLEVPHFIENIKFLQRIDPTISKIAIVYDEDQTWDGVTAKMRSELDQLPEGVEIVSWDKITSFDEYKNKISEYQTTVDVVGLLGIHTFKDSAGNNIPFQEVLEWTAENSNIPDFSFWQDRAQYGTLAVVAVSGYEQGKAAGDIAYDILVNNTPPSEIEIKPTIKGQPIVSLARANKLGIDIPAPILSSALVFNEFEWNK